MTRVRHLYSVLLVLVIVFLGLLVAPESAQAALNCTGKTPGTIVRTFSRPVPYVDAPMRCGTSTWGYLHIKARYDSDSLFDSYMAHTLMYPSRSLKYGTSITYWSQPVMPCAPLPWFKVVVEYKTYGTGPQGVITATYDTGPPAAAKYLTNPQMPKTDYPPNAPAC